MLPPSTKYFNYIEYNLESTNIWGYLFFFFFCQMNHKTIVARGLLFPSKIWGTFLCVAVCKYLGSRKTDIFFWPERLESYYIVHGKVLCFVSLVNPTDLGSAALPSAVWKELRQRCVFWGVCVGLGRRGGAFGP